MPRQGKHFGGNRNRRKRKHGGGGYHNGPPNKKRRYDNNRNHSKHSRGPRLSPEESKSKCLSIIKTLKEILEKESMDLMQLNKFNESDLGIKIFINDIDNNEESKQNENDNKTSHKPIIGNLKHKYEDFIVREIDESDKVVKITNTDNVKEANAIDKSQSMDDSIKQS